ncbi:MAG: DUF721 domain-containing protein [Treponemataceae bacterium]|nr:DUF721 domain-containing protein [Treponemataceae bacterium]
MSSSDKGYKKADEIISALFDNINASEMKESVQLFSRWKDIVSTISTSKLEGNKTGLQLAAHSRVIDLKNGILLVEADHPAYIQLLQMYKKYILTGLKRNFSNLEIKSLAFRLKGSDAKIHDRVEEEKKESVKKPDPSSYIINENLAPELQDLFKQMRDSILTKD